MSLAPGTKLGPYEIVSPLGAGGMGQVYRARDTRLERIVALNILPAQFSADPVRKQRFEREAKTISSLNHPHICVLYDVGHQDGIDYLVMECVEGETLAKRLEKGPLLLEQVLKYGAQIADALRESAPQWSCAPGPKARKHHVDGCRRQTPGFWVGKAFASIGQRNDTERCSGTGFTRYSGGRDCWDISVHVT